VSGHGGGHADAAVDTGEIIPASVEGDQMDMVADLLGMTVSQSAMTQAALPMTSALRFWPWDSLGMGATKQVRQHNQHNGDGDP